MGKIRYIVSGINQAQLNDILKQIKDESNNDGVLILRDLVPQVLEIIEGGDSRPVSFGEFVSEMTKFPTSKNIQETTSEDLNITWDLIKGYLSRGLDCPVQLTSKQMSHIDNLIKKRDVQKTDWRDIYGELKTRFIIDNLKTTSDEMAKRGLFKF